MEFKNLEKLTNIFINYSLDGVNLTLYKGDKPLIIDKSLRNIKSFLVFEEFIFFFMHLANRIVYVKLNEEKGILFQKEFLKIMFKSIEEIFYKNAPPERIYKFEDDFLKNLNKREIEYSTCKGLIDDKDFSLFNEHFNTSLINKFLYNIHILLFEEIGLEPLMRLVLQKYILELIKQNEIEVLILNFDS